MTDDSGQQAMTQRRQDPTGIDQWISRDLKQRFDAVLRERLPPELSALLADADATPPGG